MGYWGVKNLGYGIWAPLCHPPPLLDQKTDLTSRTRTKKMYLFPRTLTIVPSGIKNVHRYIIVKTVKEYM